VHPLVALNKPRKCSRHDAGRTPAIELVAAKQGAGSLGPLLLGGIRDRVAETKEPCTPEHGSRYCMVIDPEGKLACVTVYKRGAVEVVWRLAA
jgi:hypothetical protein